MATITTTPRRWLIILLQASLLILLCVDTGASAANATAPLQSGNDTLRLLLSNVASNASKTGFSTASAGEGAGQIFALAFCTADLTTDRCQVCLDAARSNVLSNYAANATGHYTVWRDYECMMRYSTQSFFGAPDVIWAWTCPPKGTPREADDYDAAMRLMKRLVAAAPAQPLLFAAGREASSYGLVQCTGVLSSGGCGDCLAKGMEVFTTRCEQNGRGRYMSGGCVLAYEDAPFFNTSLAGVVYPPALAPEPNSSSSSNHRSAGLATGFLWFFLLVMVDLFRDRSVTSGCI